MILTSSSWAQGYRPENIHPMEPGSYATPYAQHQPTVQGGHLRAGAIIPLGDGYAGSPGAGMFFDLAFWFETTLSFAVEPRVGIRFDLVSGENSYSEVPLDVGAFYVLGTGDTAFFCGVGLGPHYIWETRGHSVTVGTVIPTKTEHLSEDSGWGFGTYGRLGVMFARTNRVKFTLAAEANITIIELNGYRNPTAATVGAGMIF